MAVTQNVVLVSSPDEERRRTVTDALRDRWPVRTASKGAATVASLDDSIAVVVIDEPPAAVTADPTAAHRDDFFYQILWLGAPDPAIDDQVDAILPRDASTAALRRTVRRLQLRARYDRLLTMYYEVSQTDRSAEAPSRPPSARIQELDALKTELDRVAAKLDDDDAFEIALRTRDDD